jgi:urease gamma subunit
MTAIAKSGLKLPQNEKVALIMMPPNKIKNGQAISNIMQMPRTNLLLPKLDGTAEGLLCAESGSLPSNIRCREPAAP